MRNDDTDSLVIVLGCKHFVNTLETRLEAGVQSKNNLRFINVNSIYLELGETLCKELPSYHPLTGCDYTASFFIKGKVRLINFLQKDIEGQIILSKLSTFEKRWKYSISN